MQIKISDGSIYIENAEGVAASISYDNGFKITIGKVEMTKPGEYEYGNIAIKAEDAKLAKTANINILSVYVDNFTVLLVPDTKDLKPEYDNALDVADLLFVTNETGDLKNLANVVDPKIVFTGKLMKYARAEEEALKSISQNIQTTKTIKLKEGELGTGSEAAPALAVYILE